MTWLNLTMGQMIERCEEPGCESCPLRRELWNSLYRRVYSYCVFSLVPASRWNTVPELRGECVSLGLELKRAGRRLIDLSLDLYGQAARLGDAPDLKTWPTLWQGTIQREVPGTYRVKEAPDPDDPLLREPGPDFQSLHPEIYEENRYER